MSSDDNEVSICGFVKLEPRYIDEDGLVTPDLPSTQTSRSVQFNIDKNKYHSPPAKQLKSILRHHNADFTQHHHQNQHQSKMSRRKSFGTPSRQVGHDAFNCCTTCHREFSHQPSSAYPPPPHYPFAYPPFFPPHAYPPYFPPPNYSHYCPQIPKTQTQQQQSQYQQSHLQIPLNHQKTLIPEQIPSQDSGNNSSSDREYDSDDFLGTKRKSKKSSRHNKVSDDKSKDQDNDENENDENIENHVNAHAATPPGQKEKVPRRLKVPKEKKSCPIGDDQGKEVVESESGNMKEENLKRSKRKSVKTAKAEGAARTVKQPKSQKK